MNQALSTAPAWAATPRCVCLHLRARRRRRGRRRAQAVAVERHRAPCRRAVPVSRASHALRLDLRGIPWLRLGSGRCLGSGCAGAGGGVVRAGGRSSLLPAPNVSRPARKPQFSCQTLQSALPAGNAAHGGLRRFLWGRIPGCYVTKFAPHMALKSSAGGKLTFSERVAVHRVDHP